MSVDDFVAKQLVLLDLEEKAELEENELKYEDCTLEDLKATKQDYALCHVDKIESGMCNRRLVTLKKRNADQVNLLKTFRPGCLALVGQAKNDGDWSFKALGVISCVKSDYVVAALNSTTGLDENILCYLFKTSNFNLFKQLKNTLTALLKKSIRNEMISVLFGQSAPNSIDSSTLKFDFINRNLNVDQQEAVKFVLCQKEIAILHGPPGTGKTTTVLEVILQFVKQGLKVLACAPSNVAVDNIVEGLSHYNAKVIRLGHPARVLPNCYRYNQDYLLEQNEDMKIVKDVEKNIQALNSMIADYASNYNGNKCMQKKVLERERRRLQQEVKHRRDEILKDILKNCDIVASTLTSAFPQGVLGHLPQEHFDVVVIDECSQALEVECWIPLLYVKRCVLAGDHLQLPPVICSTEAAEKGLSLTLMERVLKMYDDKVKKLLTIQYRMHSDIMQWSSKELYGNVLKAHESVASHRLCDLPGVEENKDTVLPLLMIDTVGTCMHDYELEEDGSKGNVGEAQLVAVHVESLINSGVNISDIAVITPYNLQLDLIKQLLSTKYPELEARSVDGFQGREKEAVVLSLVRSNIEGEVGFLNEHRRLNVAITRARRHLTVICDSSTVSNNEYFKSFVDYMQEFAEIRSAFQYLSDLPPLVGHPEANVKQSAKPKAKKSTPNKAPVKQKAEPKDRPSNTNQMNSSTDENETDQRRERYRGIIEKFMQNTVTVMKFPPHLSSYDRMLVHEIAEELGIIHKSEGEGTERFIMLMKQEHVISEPPNAFANLAIEDSDTECKANTSDKIESELPTSQQCSMALPTPAQKVDKNAKNSTQVKKKCTAAKDPPAKPNAESAYKDALDSNSSFDELLNTVTALDNSCHFQKCKNSIKYLLQTCHFCNLRFCLAHHQAEVHGCGAAAKAHAHSRIRKEGKLYPGSGKPKKAVNPYLKAELERKMQKKMTELSEKRKPKNPVKN